MTSKKRKAEGINAGSMADVAFLLLIFFLVVTTVHTEQGIAQKLPPADKVSAPSKSVILHVLVNKKDQLMLNGEEISLAQLKKKTLEFITNPKGLEDLPSSPQAAIISLQNDMSTSYEVYIGVLNELHAAYNELRSDYAKVTFNKAPEDLNGDELKEVHQAYPIKISEADPIVYQ